MFYTLVLLLIGLFLRLFLEGRALELLLWGDECVEELVVSWSLCLISFISPRFEFRIPKLYPSTLNEGVYMTVISFWSLTLILVFSWSFSRIPFSASPSCVCVWSRYFHWLPGIFNILYSLDMVCCSWLKAICLPFFVVFPCFMFSLAHLSGPNSIFKHWENVCSICGRVSSWSSDLICSFESSSDTPFQ